MEDTSLDQFVDATDESDGEGADEPTDEETAEDDTAAEEVAGDADDRGSSVVPVAPGDVEPAVSTATWTPGGGVCKVCDSTTERRWRENGTLVCVDCKDW